MPQTGYCTDVTCDKELTELYECHCCNWLICLKHLLEHVEISKRDKKQQFDLLRNELISVSHALELIVEKKIHEIEREQQLINQAKTILDMPNCFIQEIQQIFDEINQAIVSNRKEETIVKVEPSLSDMKTCSCSNEKLEISSSYSPSKDTLEPPKSPIYRAVRSYTNESEESTTTKSDDHSTKVNNKFNNINILDGILDSIKDEADSEEHNQENPISPENPLEQCPLTFDGAFGLTKAKHSIEICPIDKSRRRNLIGHFKHKHQLKHISAYRLLQAIKYGQDPKTTKLFSENEIVINYDRQISCPFSSNMINLIGCCPTQSRNIPCRYESVLCSSLVLHLKNIHRLPFSMGKKIAKSYKEKLSKMITSNDNNPISY